MALAFRCGHGTDGGVVLQRECPLCMLITETGRSRTELIRRASAPGRAALANETRVGAEYQWRCERGHDRYTRTVMQVLTGTGCPKCMANAEAPAASRDGGLAYMNPGLRTRTSLAEQRLRALLEERIRVPRGVNAVRINRTFHGRTEVWPDIVIPAIRMCVEYDSPGRDKRAHNGLRAASDRDKDAALADVGWQVIRVRTGGLESLGENSIVCAAGLTIAAVDQVVDRMRALRGDEAVDALLVPA